MYICAKITDHDAIRLVQFACFLGKERIGGAQLILYPTASHLGAVLDDVAIREDMQGRGYGTMLVEHVLRYLVEYANDTKRAIRLMFTSRPSRERANRLYERLGFEKAAAAVDHPYGTNLYRFTVLPTESKRTSLPVAAA
jgi:ribosomal protein S18 acetylase RimI-like enzyme